ncbi:hypothetical protein GM921_11715 [Pedobacter sp. LMG 31464]|uniref:Adhesin domain-containing protein n=1 Tax=Pedobacter planticolens TaxID=2679964 RepID=A0A923DZX9_9SPHI|nr:hypothetical protein [Pedobacter planticolens]MBB2146156.1 hypothetical protein [Pedobacter planticolens]
MKKLTLSISGMLLLAIQVNAQQQPSVSVNVSTSPTVSVTKSSNISYTTNSSVNVNSDVNVTTSVNVQEVGDDPMKAKTFSKSFSLDKNDKINLSNQYGNIVIKTWDKDEIKVDVDIKAYAKTDEDAQKLLDDVSITATKTGDLVTYRTNVGERNGDWGRRVKNGKTVWRREAKVYYTVYMPSSNALTAGQSYGNITMDDFSGPTSLKVQYGNLITGDLRNTNNYVNVQYGKANLKNVNQARINHEYGGGLTVASINDLELDAQYTSVNIGTIKNNANIKQQYGSGCTIGYAGSLNLTAEYSNVKLDKLGGIFTGKVEYGKLDIGTVENGCKILNVDADYSPVILGFSPAFNAEFTVNTSYGGFKYGSNVTAKKQGDDRSYSSSKSYSGQIGKGGTARVSVKTEYESVTFK